MKPQPEPPSPPLPATLLDRIPDGFYALDREWRYTYVNRAAAELVERTPDELIGRNVWHLFPEAVDLPFYTEAHRAMREQTPVRFEAFYPPLGKWFESDLYPSADGLIIVSRDVTARKQAEATIRFQAQLLDSVGQAVIATDLQGTISYWNRAAADLYGWTRDEVLGRSILDVTPSRQSRHQAAEIMARLLRGGSWTGEFVVQRRDGTEFLALVTDVPVRDATGTLTGIVGVSTDISAHRQAEATLAESLALLDTFLDNAPVAVAFVDRDFRHLRVNAAGAAMSGATPDAVLGRTIAEVAPDFWPALEPLYRGVLETGQPVLGGEVSGRASPGQEPRTYLASYYPVRHPERGEILGVGLIVNDLTERKQAEAALARQLRLNETISMNTRLALFLMDSTQHCTFMNPAAEQMTGYTLAEVQGRPLHDLVHHSHPDGTPYPLADCPIDRALPERNRMQGEEVFVHKDGTFYPVAFTASPIVENGTPVGTVIEVEDITERRRAEAALHESEAHLRRLFDSDLIGILFWHLDGAITDANDCFLQMVGYTRADLEAGRLRWTDLTPEEYRLLDEEKVAEIRATGAHRPYEKEYLRKDGSRIPVVVGSTRFEEAFERGVSFVLDISDRKQAERTRDALLATVTHDLKNPLGLIKGMAQVSRRQLVREGRDTEDRLVKSLTSIDDATTRMAAMLNELVDTARLQAGAQLDLTPQPADLVTIGREVVAAYEQTTPGHTVRFASEADGLNGMWDRERLKRVLDNLIGNAVKYSPEGGVVTVRVRAVRTPEGQEWAEVAVEDRGIGIPAADLSHVFEPFYRAANAPGRAQGTGLGLAGVKQIVEQHGGSIGVVSVEGVGSTFTVRLPLT